MRRAARVMAASWLVLAACDSTISLGHDERQSDGGEAAVEDAVDDSAVSSTTGSSTTGSSATGSSGERGDSSDDGSQSSGSEGHDGHATHGTDDETTGDVTEACSFDPRDGECLNCVKSFCCPEAQSCAGEPGCACLFGCLSEEGTPSACSQQCEPNVASMQLAICIGMSCPGACS